MCFHEKLIIVNVAWQQNDDEKSFRSHCDSFRKNCNKEHLHPTSFKSFSMTGSKKRLSTVVSFENENNKKKDSAQKAGSMSADAAQLGSCRRIHTREKGGIHVSIHPLTKNICRRVIGDECLLITQWWLCRGGIQPQRWGSKDKMSCHDSKSIQDFQDLFRSDATAIIKLWSGVGSCDVLVEAGCCNFRNTREWNYLQHI